MVHTVVVNYTTVYLHRAYAFTTRPGIEGLDEGFPTVVNFDVVDPAGSNSLRQCNSGARTLAHELGHANGLFPPSTVGKYSMKLLIHAMYTPGTSRIHEYV